MGFFLNAFLLEVAGVEPSQAGTLLLVAKLVDAVADPFIGWASDRTRTRWGRRKVWIAVSMVPLSVAYFVIWIVPPGIAEDAKFWYYLCMLVLLSVAISCVTLPASALAPELTENYDERTSLMVFKVGAFSVATIVATFAHSMLVEAFPAAPPALALPAADPASLLAMLPAVEAPAPRNVSSACANATASESAAINYELGYLVSALVWAILSLVPLVLLLFLVPERTSAAREKPAVRRDGSIRRKTMTVLQSLLSMVRNRAFICVMLVYLFSQLAIQFVQNNLYLWTKYVLLREEWFSYLLLVLLGTSFLMLPLWELASQRWGKRLIYVVGVVVLLAALVWLFFAEWQPMELRDVLCWFAVSPGRHGGGVGCSIVIPISQAAIAGVALSALLLIPVAMFPDVIERDELETGMRREGIYYSFFVFFQKMALAFALAISNFILERSGYISPELAGCSTPAQPGAVKLALAIMLGPIPAGILLLSLVALWFYPITKETHLRTLAQLDEQRKQRALVTTDNEATHASRSAEAEPEPNRSAIDFDAN